MALRIGKNAPCPCGSGLKYKNCCLKKSKAPADTPAPPSGHGFKLSPRMARLLDFFIVPGLLIALAYEPNAAHGYVDYLESGQYLAVIDGVFRGQVFYRDIYFFFGPLSYYGPALAMFFFGKTLAVLRQFFLVGDIAGFLALYALCRITLRNRFFAYAAALVIVIQVHHPFWSTRWGGFRFCSAYASLIVMAGLVRWRSTPLAAVGGFFAAIAFLHSIDMGVLCGLAAAAVFVADRWLPDRAQGALPAQASFYYGLGFAAGLAPLLIYFAVSGALFPYLKEMASLGDRRVWAAPIDWSSRSGFKVFFPLIVYTLAAVTGFARGRLERLQTALLVTFGVLFYFYAFRAIAGPQFETSLAVCILLGFCALERLLERSPSGHKPAWQLPAAALLGVGMFATMVFIPNYFYAGDFKRWFAYQQDKDKLFSKYVMWDREGYRAVDAAIVRMKGTQVPAWQADEIETVLRSVDQFSGKDDALLAFPDLSFFNFIADRRLVDRFSVPGFAHGVPGGERTLLAAVGAERPPVALRPAGRSVLANAIRKDEILPSVREYVDNNYALNQKTEQVLVYVRNS